MPPGEERTVIFFIPHSEGLLKVLKMPEKSENRTWSEEIEIASSELVERVKELIMEGNVRRLIIRNPSGEILLEIPLTTGVVVGGVVGSVVIIYAPLIAALGAMAAFLSRVKVEIIRIEPKKDGE